MFVILIHHPINYYVILLFFFSSLYCNLTRAGYNVCIIAYGQTGSGKTFTMMGPNDNMGVNRRAIRELLALCERSKEIKYTLKVVKNNLFSSPPWRVFVNFP